MALTLLLAISRHDGKRLGEVAFLLVIVAGIGLAAAPLRQVRNGRLITQLAGLVLALAGLLLAIASHWGKFG